MSTPVTARADRQPRRAALITVVTLGLIVTAMTAGPQGPALAEVVEGTCTGTASMAGEVIIDASEARTDPVPIPPSGTVEFTGTFDRPADDTEPLEATGELRAGHPFGSWALVDWSGTTTTGEAIGQESYDIPTFLPRGSGVIPLELDLSVGDDRCRILADVTVEGPRWDGLSIAMLIVTLLLLGAAVAAGRANTRGRGRPVLGAVAGLLAGVTGAMTLFGIAAIALDSVWWWLLPLLLAALGLLLGAVAPFGGEDVAADDPVVTGETDTGPHGS